MWDQPGACLTEVGDLRTRPTRVVSELFTEMPGQRWDMDRKTENGIKARKVATHARR